MYETVKFDGVDVKSTGVRLLRVWEGVLLDPPLRGEDLVVVDSDGESEVDDRAFEAFDVSIGLGLKGLTGTAFNDAHRALALMCKIGRTVTLTRRKSYTSGDEEHTALCRYRSGLGPQMFGMTEGDLTLVMRNLNGCWYGASTTIADGTHTVTGTARTRRMTITFTGGTSPTLTNSTTGDVLAWTGGAVGGTAVVVDVETITATQGVTNVSGALTHSRTFPMTLLPGSNTLVLTGGGSVSIAYNPVHLV